MRLSTTSESRGSADAEAGGEAARSTPAAGHARAFAVIHESGFFGPDGRRLFGHFFRPANPPAKRLGLVICSPFGFEAVCARRSLKTLAEAAAGAGFPALHFDYAGCGDSEGDDFGAGQMASWIESIHEAVSALKSAGGVSQVCIAGLRLGSSLAALAASSRDDVTGLIAIAPVVRGHAYLRELRVIGATGTVPPAPPVDRRVALESAGFAMSAETCDALEKLDLRSLARSPAPRVLMIERDNLPGLDGWPEALRGTGAQVDAQSWPGFVAMTDDPKWAKVPTLMFDGILESLARWRAAAGTAGPDPRPGVFTLESTVSSDVNEHRVEERVVRIGDGGGLFGIVTTSSIPLGGKGRPGVLMCNPGAVHHVGPNRLWVRLARRWAAAGFTVLRIDLSGLGDSPPRPGAEVSVIYSENALRDIAESLAFLKRELGAGPCHLLGLCSGGYHAFKAAISGDAVASATMINFFWGPGTVRDDALTDYSRLLMVNRYRRGIFSLAPWTRLLRGQLDLPTILLAIAHHVRSLTEHRLREWARSLGWKLQQDLATELRNAVDRGTRLHFFFSEHDPAYEMLVRQAGSTVRRLHSQGSLTLEVLTDADHTFTPHAARERLVALLDQTFLNGEQESDARDATRAPAQSTPARDNV